MPTGAKGKNTNKPGKPGTATFSPPRTRSQRSRSLSPSALSPTVSTPLSPRTFTSPAASSSSSLSTSSSPSSGRPRTVTPVSYASMASQPAAPSAANRTPFTHHTTNQHNTTHCKYTVKNIPKQHATQSGFYTILVTTLNLRNIHTLIVNNNQTALLITTTPLKPNFQQTLATATNAPEIQIAPANSRSPQPQRTTPKPALSLVIRDVPMDIAPMEIHQAMEDLDLKPFKIWRIISRSTNQHTRLIRVLTHDPQTLNHLLNRGISLFGRHLRCEPSNPSPPVPVQCSRCFQLGHSAPACNARQACPDCIETHPPGRCSAKELTCLLCLGSHNAYSRKCPKLKSTIVSETVPAIPTVVFNTPKELAAPVEPIEPQESEEETPIDPPSLKQVIAFVTKVLYDLLPNSRPQIHTTVQGTVRALFAKNLKITHSGHRIYFAIE